MNQYQVGGSLRQDHPYYIPRQADTDLYQALRDGQLCYVFNARQMGKSSLMVRVLHQLQQDGMSCGAIDLSRIGSQTLTVEQWYKGFAVELWQAFDLCHWVNLKQWWDERSDLSPVQRLGLFIEEIVLFKDGVESCSQPNLVLFLDEVDCVCSLDFSLNDFFALIRSCYNRRSLQPAYRRLTFALLGVTTPFDLVSDRHRTPFNIGRAIDLSGLHPANIQPMAAGLAGCLHHPTEGLQTIVNWTGGQPFLMQKVCQLVTEHPLLTTSITDQDHIQHLVQTFIIQHWDYQDEPEHLRTIRDRLLHNPQLTGSILGTYQEILQAAASSTAPAVTFNGSRDQLELLLSGLVINQQGTLVVKNPIYQAVFNASWVQQQLTLFRPYADSLLAWIDSHRTDAAVLLRGQTLQSALSWALGKSLSHADYQFLGASQDLAKREAEMALETVEQASQLFATARQRAHREVNTRRLRWRWLPGVAVGITLAVLLIRSLGVLQGMELSGFDQWMRWRSLEPLDDRLVIVAIDEQDVTQVGYPVPDGVLAQAIQTIQTQNPRGVGLDIYRDLPVNPGHSALVKVFQSSPNLIGIEKIVGSRVAPPPILQQQQQVGFVDQVEDADGTVRRALLAVAVDTLPHQSFAVRLALDYLKPEGVTLCQLDAAGHRFELGKATFERLTPQDGGYVNADAGQSYQILLNYRGTEANFHRVSLRRVLAGHIAPEQFRNRVVLIGYTAESVGDRFRTPYNGSWFQSVPPINGVMLHANIVSQLISAALEGRSLIRVWSEPLEAGWVLLWAGVGGLLGWGVRSPIRSAIAGLGVSLGLISGSYAAFLFGWWIPLVPALLSLWGTAIVLLIITHKRRDRLQFQRTFALLLEAQPTHPTATRIAIAYLQRSEPQEYQIDRDRLPRFTDNTEDD